MAEGSRERVRAAKRARSEAALEREARSTPAPPPLRLDPSGFDLIAELKLRSPAAGRLGAPDESVAARMTAYARAGSAAVSVLTEPSRFDGTLDDLASAARSLALLAAPAAGYAVRRRERRDLARRRPGDRRGGLPPRAHRQRAHAGWGSGHTRPHAPRGGPRGPRGGLDVDQDLRHDEPGGGGGGARGAGGCDGVRVCRVGAAADAGASGATREAGARSRALRGGDAPPDSIGGR